MGLLKHFIILGVIVFIVGSSITSVFAITDEERDILSDMSSKRTQEIEELIFLTGDKINAIEWIDSNYNITSMCTQLLERPDVSAPGLVGCSEFLGK
jgi:hypothetical protein